MRRIALVLLALPLLLGADKCSISWPQPQPSPTPTVETTPEPTPEPTPTPQPTPTPTPEPTAPPPTQPPATSCTAPMYGSPNMGAYWYSPQRVADATPRLCSSERCNEVGYAGRACCPVVVDEHPERARCECLLMTGTASPVCSPKWELEQDAGANLRWGYDDTEWKAVVSGAGKGRIRACFPNGKACSKWLDIDK